MLNISKNANPNYLATICRIEELTPIPNADRLVKTVINGYDLVISKDSKVGDLVVYFPVETAINETFLSPNNLYELSECELNDNFMAVLGIKCALKNEMPGSEKYNELMTQAKSMCGFFNKYGRVRILRLRGQYSQGFIAGVNSLEIAYPELVGTDWEAMVGTKFDSVGTKLVCEKYIPSISQPICQGDGQKHHRKSMKKLKRFDKLIPDQFVFHYDTTMLAERISIINPEDSISVTVKVHGTSVILSKILCRRELTTWEKIKKFFGAQVEDTIYDNIYSSRRVIKNRYINKNKGEDFYGTDVWGSCNNVFSKFLEDGMTVYGEIVGYCEGTNNMIQKEHDYGCKPGQWKFMPYRITGTNKHGDKYEYEILKVMAWVDEVLEKYGDEPAYGNYKIKDVLMRMDLLYYGKLKDMYPNLDPNNENFYKTILEKMKNDKDRLGMELDEPMCKNKVPREGIVVRIVEDVYSRAWKLKSLRHYGIEAQENDGTEVNIEDAN